MSTSDDFYHRSIGQGISDRHVSARRWWIASELVRRHPELRFYRSYEALQLQGLSGPLILGAVPSGDRDGATVILDFAGIYMPMGTKLMDWNSAFSAADPIDVVRFIEQALGLDDVAKAPRSDSFVLVHRVLARVLSMMVDDSRAWQVWPIASPSGAISGFKPFLEAYPDLNMRRGGFVTSEESLAWVLCRDDEPAALFETSGRVHTSESSFNLWQLHRRMRRNLSATTTTALASVLP